MHVRSAPPLLLMASTATDAAAVARVLRATDHYAVLGIALEVSAEDVKHAYRALSLKVHPDRNKQPRAEEAFKVLGAAYAVLSDEQERVAYDKRNMTNAEIVARNDKSGKQAKPAPKNAAEQAAEAELERQLDRELEALRNAEWVASARREQGFVIRVASYALVFVVLGLALFVVHVAMPASPAPNSNVGSSAFGVRLWVSLSWYGSFVGRLVLGGVLLACSVLAAPFALKWSVEGLGKLCELMFDLCEFCWLHAVTPFIEHLLRGPGAPPRSAQRGGGRRRGKR